MTQSASRMHASLEPRRPPPHTRDCASTAEPEEACENQDLHSRTFCYIDGQNNRWVSSVTLSIRAISCQFRFL